MAKEAPTYDLMLLLSADAEEDQRKKILADVESAISAAGGSIERDDDWGRRPLSYEIRHRADAEYRLLQFHAPPTLIDELSHTLKITDGVLRFRVIKGRPGTPPAPSSPPPVVVAAPGSTHASAPSAPSEAPAETASETPADAASESPTDTAADSPANSASDAPAGAADDASPSEEPESDGEATHES
jgi:small subunit ribosomal protein S6